MYEAEQLIFDLDSLAKGEIVRQVVLDNDFFLIAQQSEIGGGCVEVSITMQQSGDAFRTNIEAKGIVDVVCDRCLDTMQQAISTTNELIIRYGEMPDDADPKAAQCSDDGETIIVDPACGEVNLAWFIYESIALAIPVRHIHAPGQCNDAMIERLEQMKPAHATARSSKDEEATTDPRWDALKGIKL